MLLSKNFGLSKAILDEEGLDFSKNLYFVYGHQNFVPITPYKNIIISIKINVCRWLSNIAKHQVWHSLCYLKNLDW